MLPKASYRFPVFTNETAAPVVTVVSLEKVKLFFRFKRPLT